MHLLEIGLEFRVFVGIVAMVLLFASFVAAMLIDQRRKIRYQQSVQALLEQKQQMLTEQNQVLEQKVTERTAQLRQQAEQLQQSLTELEATQQQLIQREKMASLGELTAGIAHEIQNPLNFINNFSELSIEMFAEAEGELQNGNTRNALEVITGLKGNLEKINYHGKRADNIVKGMLQHARTSTGQKEPVNLNELADECLRLSYHGLRAKDKMVNVQLKTIFDANLPPVKVVQEEISRVLINILNNAVYAVMQQKKKAPADYAPTVSITTSHKDKYAVVNINDNGTGIPAQVLDKIFQPFFTTKHTGEGTGLGLSMSYDIITKGHGGKLEVKSEEGQGSTFTILLPV